MVVLRIGSLIIGIIIALSTVGSAIATFVLPRSAPDRLTRLVFRRMRDVFDMVRRVRRISTYEGRDRLMAYYAPVTLILLPGVWLTLILVGYTLIYWALGVEPIEEAMRLSGSSMLTLGFSTSPQIGLSLIEFTQAAIGMMLLTLLIAYLPTMYAAFSKREAAVAMLEVRAGTPPSVLQTILRYHNLRDLRQISELWVTWEVWFAEVDESHTSLAALAFFRSPRSDRSWVTAAGAVLDTASLFVSTIEDRTPSDDPRDVRAQICIRAGFLCLRHIADFFDIEYNPDPRPDDPISIRREEFDEVCDQLQEQGVPLKPDRDQCWRDFAGWRVNYDTVLLALAALTEAPYAPWSSDRSLLRWRRRRTLWGKKNKK